MDPNDIDELQGSLNDAAGKASVLWTTFITFLVYLTIALGSVKHRDLFLGTPIQLPLLNVQLPLTGFFVVAPTLVLLFHFYVVLQLVALAKKAQFYDQALREAVPVRADRQALRQRLDSFLILQFLAGPRDQREGFVGLTLRVISWLTMVGAPLLVLLLAQVTFLPYHNEWILDWQRFLLVLDLVLVWFVWTRIRVDRDAGAELGSRKLWSWVGGFATVCVCFFAFVISYPGEFLYDHTPYVRFIPTTSPMNNGWETLHDFLFAGPNDDVSGQPRSLLYDSLVLMDQSFVDDPDKLEKLEVSHSFRGRDLRFAKLSRSDLRKADFTGARLDPAYLVRTNLDGAKLGCPPQNAPSGCALLQRVDFEKAQLQGADLSRALLQSADLTGALLRGADLSKANLKGALLRKAQLQGADLSEAHLEGADLSNARLQGADLSKAHLEGADLSGAWLQGADLSEAKLLGADLSQTQSQGADLSEAHLQGANLAEARLQDASLDGAFLWRVRGTPVIDGATIEGFHSHTKEWEETSKASSFASWSKTLLEGLPEDLYNSAMKRLSFVDPAQNAPDDLTNRELWAKASVTLASQDEREPRLAALFADLACAKDSGPYVARALIGRQRMASTGAMIIAAVTDRLRKGKSDPSACPGVVGFTVEDWIDLAELCSHYADRLKATAVFGTAPRPTKIDCGYGKMFNASSP